MLRVAKAAKIIDRLYPNYCPCCKSKCQTIKYWFVECPYFNDLCDEFSSIFPLLLINLVLELLLLVLLILKFLI